jgi:nucleotide-binding universal stress UspA family protein
MTWLLVLGIAGVVVTVALWAVFVYIAVREMKAAMPHGSFAGALRAQWTDEPAALRMLVPIDGSEASAAAVREIAHCPLPAGSTIELLYSIHSRLPVIPDFPPWAVTIAALHGEVVRAQARQAPEVLDAAAKYLQSQQPHATVVSKTVEGIPKNEILREAASWEADRIVLGSHGRGHGERAILGSTAAAVAAEAPCSVQIARPRRAASAPLVRDAA